MIDSREKQFRERQGMDSSTDFPILENKKQIIETIFGCFSIIIKPKQFLVTQEEIESNFSGICQTIDELLELTKKIDLQRTLIIGAKKNTLQQIKKSEKLWNQLIQRKKAVQIICLDKKKIKDKEKIGNITITYVDSWEGLVKQNKYQQSQGTFPVFDFTFLTNCDKFDVNIKQYNMKIMLEQFNREKALKDFLDLSKEYVELKEYINQLKTYSDVAKDYPRIFDPQEILKLYTRETFFYKFINHGSRSFGKDVKKISYFRLPFKDIYNSIQDVYRIKQKSWNRRKKKIILYRGVKFSHEDEQQLINNKNEYLQTESFLSTSLNLNVAGSFGSQIIQIQIPYVEGYNDYYEHGFAFIVKDGGYTQNEQKYEQYAAKETSQAEVLINSGSIFKIIDAKKINDGGPIIFYAKFKYIHQPKGWSQKFKEIFMKDEKYKQLVEHLQFQQKELKDTKTQGDVFYKQSNYKEAVQFFDKCEVEGQFKDPEMYRKRGMSRLKLTGSTQKNALDFSDYLKYCKSLKQKTDRKLLYKNLQQFYVELREKQKSYAEQIKGEVEKFLQQLKGLEGQGKILEENENQLLKIAEKRYYIEKNIGKNDEYLELLIQESIIQESNQQYYQVILLFYEAHEILSNNEKERRFNDLYRRTILRVSQFYNSIGFLLPKKWQVRFENLPSLKEIEKEGRRNTEKLLLEYDKIAQQYWNLAKIQYGKSNFQASMKIYQRLSGFFRGNDTKQKLYRKYTNAGMQFFFGHYKECHRQMENIFQSLQLIKEHEQQCQKIQTHKFPFYKKQINLEVVIEIDDIMNNAAYLQDGGQFYWNKEGDYNYFFPGIGVKVYQPKYQRKFLYEKSFIENELQNIVKERYHFINSLWLMLIPFQYFGEIGRFAQDEIRYLFEQKRKSKVDIFFFLGEMLFKNGNYDDALYIFNVCQDRIKKVYGESYRLAKIFLYKAQCLYIMQKKAKSQFYYKKCFVYMLQWEKKYNQSQRKSQLQQFLQASFTLQHLASETKSKLEKHKLRRQQEEEDSEKAENFPSYNENFIEEMIPSFAEEPVLVLTGFVKNFLNDFKWG